MPHSPTNFKAPFSPLCLSSFAFSLTARSPLLSSPRFHFPFSLAFTSHFYHIPFSFPSLSLSIHNLFLTCSIYLLVDKSEFLPYCVIKDVYHAKSHRIHEKHLDIATSRFQPSPLARVVRVYTPVKFIFLLSLLSHKIVSWTQTAAKIQRNWCSMDVQHALNSNVKVLFCEKATFSSCNHFFSCCLSRRVTAVTVKSTKLLDMCARVRA